MKLRPLPARVQLSDLVAEAKRLGPSAHPEIVVWGADVGAEGIEDAYSKGAQGPTGRSSGADKPARRFCAC